MKYMLHIYIKLHHANVDVGPSPGRCRVPGEGAASPSPDPVQLLGWEVGQRWLRGPALLPQEAPVVPAPQGDASPYSALPRAEHKKENPAEKQLSIIDPRPAFPRQLSSS